MKARDNKLETVVISDGELLSPALSLCGKSETDVFNILNKNNKSITDVFIMTLDSSGNYKIIDREVE